VLDQKGESSPLPSSFLGRALKVDNYGFSVLVSEVKETKLYSFFLKATNHYDKVSFAPIDLDITKEVNHLPFFDGDLKTEFSIAFDEEGVPDPPLISYSSPAIKEIDGDKYEVEFDYDSSLRSFIQLSLSGSKIHL